MTEMTLAQLVDFLRQELQQEEENVDASSRLLRPESVELDVSLAIGPGESGETRVTLATDPGSEKSGLHRARIRFRVGNTMGWQAAAEGPLSGGPGDGLPVSRDALMADTLQPAPGAAPDPDFDQSDFDRMMDEIEGVTKKKKKRKKS